MSVAQIGHLDEEVNLFKKLQIMYVQLDWTPSRNTRKINSLTSQKSCVNSETTIGKLSTRRIQITCVYFCKSYV